MAIMGDGKPITKAEIEAIRGVDISASLETLIERRFVRLAGRKDSPGRPFLYATTMEFLRHFGLKSLEALPSVQFPTIQEPGASALVAAPPALPAPTEPGTTPEGGVGDGSAERRSRRPTEPQPAPAAASDAT